jgi:hypothetical protein
LALHVSLTEGDVDFLECHTAAHNHDTVWRINIWRFTLQISESKKRRGKNPKRKEREGVAAHRVGQPFNP